MSGWLWWPSQSIGDAHTGELLVSYVRFRRLLNEGTFVLIKAAAHSEFSVLGAMNTFFLLTVKCEYFSYPIVSYSVLVFASLFVIFLSNCPKSYIATVRNLTLVEGSSVMQVTSDSDGLWNVHQQQSRPTSLARACKRSVTDSGHVDNVPQRRLLRRVIVSVLSTPSQGTYIPLTSADRLCSVIQCNPSI